MDRFVTHHRSNQFKPKPTKRLERKFLEEENLRHLRRKILEGTNEEWLDVRWYKGKGRGVVARKRFEREEFIVEYKGELIDVREARVREHLYAQDESIGSYMYFFKHRGKSYCVDATEETCLKGRLVNHSYLRPNARTKVVDFGTSFHLVLVAEQDIEAGEEVLYDYGDRSAKSVERNPWLLHT